MASFNKVLLMGNITRDPEIRYTPSGAALCALGLAVNRKFTTSKGEEREETVFVDLEVWGRQAESCQNYLKKGAPVFVEGRLKFDQWDDRETGRKRSRLMVTAERVQFLGPPSKGADFGESPREFSQATMESAPSLPHEIPNAVNDSSSINPPPFPKSPTEVEPASRTEGALEDESMDDIPF